AAHERVTEVHRGCFVALARSTAPEIIEQHIFIIGVEIASRPVTIPASDDATRTVVIHAPSGVTLNIAPDIPRAVPILEVNHVLILVASTESDPVEIEVRTGRIQMKTDHSAETHIRQTHVSELRRATSVARQDGRRAVPFDGGIYFHRIVKVDSACLHDL